MELQRNQPRQNIFTQFGSLLTISHSPNPTYPVNTRIRPSIIHLAISRNFPYLVTAQILDIFTSDHHPVFFKTEIINPISPLLLLFGNLDVTFRRKIALLYVFVTQLMISRKQLKMSKKASSTPDSRQLFRE